MEEEREPNEMEPSSIFDQFPVTLGDSEDQVSHQTAAGEEEEGAAAEQATAAEGRRDDSRTKVSTQISTPERFLQCNGLPLPPEAVAAIRRGRMLRQIADPGYRPVPDGR